MPRYYLVADVVLSGRELQLDQISPLRALYLGELRSSDEASSIARSRRPCDRFAVIDANVRECVNHELGMMYGLTSEQIGKLRSGETLTIEDSMGSFQIAYRTSPDDC